jgi:ABC-type Fe3+-hydroxamate transport system substrate-binding protein
MKIKHLQFAALALVPVTLLILSACSSSTPAEQTSAVHTSATSTTFVDTYRATATVAAVDATTRKVKLTLANGNHITVKCGPDVANFKQIHVNDVVKVTVTEEVAAYLDKGGRLGVTSDGSLEAAAIGAKPGGALVERVQETVKIVAIDTKTRKVTFRDKDGISKTVKVREHIDLAKAKVGDSVTISHTLGIAVSVEKP